MRLAFVDETSRIALGGPPAGKKKESAVSQLFKTVQSLFSYIRPGYIHTGYNRDHGGTTEPERSRNVKIKRTCHPVFVLDLRQNDLLELHGSVYNLCRLRSELR